jgi:hypothetical protein
MLPCTQARVEKETASNACHYAGFGIKYICGNLGQFQSAPVHDEIARVLLELIRTLDAWDASGFSQTRDASLQLRLCSRALGAHARDRPYKCHIIHTALFCAIVETHSKLGLFARCIQLWLRMTSYAVNDERQQDFESEDTAGQAAMRVQPSAPYCKL